MAPGRPLTRAWITLLGALCALALAPAGAAAEAAERTGRAVIVLEPPRLAPGVDARARAARAEAVASAHERAQRVAERFGLRRSGTQVPELGGLVVDIPRGHGVRDLRRALAGTPGIVGVEPEYRRKLTLRGSRHTPNDPGFAALDPNAPGNAPAQWNLIRQNFPAAWARSTGQVKVGIVDSGLDAAHPDLGPQLDAAVNRDSGSDSASVDENGHGTHVSGLACARADNGFGIAGSGFRCRIEMQKTDLSDGSIAASIRDATDRGAKVLNLSLGGPGDSTIIERAIVYAFERDVVIVVAAANEPIENQGVPARYVQPQGTAHDIGQGRGLVVTAASFDDRRASFAGHGSMISIAAYGHAGSEGRGILSTFPGNTADLERITAVPLSPGCECRTSVGGDNRFAYLSGTSMATPQVAGAAALARWINPELGNVQIVQLLKLQARRSGGWNPDLGWGIVNAGAAVDAALLAERVPPVSNLASARRVRSTTAFRIRVFADDPGGPHASGLRGVQVFRAINRFRNYKRLGTIRASRFDENGRFAFRFRGRRGDSYRFYARAIDEAGNVEPLPSGPETRTTILRHRRR